MAAFSLRRPEPSQKRPVKITIRFKRTAATDGAQAITAWPSPPPPVMMPAANGGDLLLKKTGGGATDGAPPVIMASSPPPPVTANGGCTLRIKKKTGATDGAPATAANGGPPTTQEISCRVAPPKNMKKKKKTEEEVLTAVRERNRRKQKRFSVSITKEEREEDLKAIGQYLKPRRRIKKRPAQLDQTTTENELFPGLYLGKITENSYAVKNFR